MLKSLSIQNFQSHKKTELEFDPGINVITGASDSGKTAIIRAMLWLLQNRPGGKAFQSTWAEKTLVQIEVDNNIIKRFRDKNNNNYFLNNLKFNAIGMDVPKEILNILNIGEINISRQLDRPFLLDDSPGEVAGHFNRIAHLDVIDKGLQNIQKWLRAIDQDIRSGEQYQIELKEELREYDYLDQMEVEIEVLEQMESSKIAIAQKIQKLKALIDNIEDVDDQIKQVSSILPAEKQINFILDLFVQELQLSEKKSFLWSMITKLSFIQQAIEENQEIIKCEKQVNEILSLYDLQDEQIRKTEGLVSLINNISSAKEQIKEKELRILEMQQDFDYHMPDICPLCEQEIK